MKTLLASALFGQIEQAFPFFLEYIEALKPSPDKIVLLDLALEQKLKKHLVDKKIEIRREKLETDFSLQLSGFRNSIIATAKKENFDAVIFLQPNIFPPSDLLSRLFASKKEIIAPAFFIPQNNGVFSNAVKIIEKEDEKEMNPFRFEELLPGGIKKAGSVMLSAVFFSKNAFEKLVFEPAKDSIEELLFLADWAQKEGLEIFIDSSTVCSVLSQKQLFAAYYSKAQKAP